MALEIEDGSINDLANSYVTDEEFLLFALAQGYTLPSSEAERNALLVRAFTFLNFTYEARLQGDRVSPQVQTGILPRDYMQAYGADVASDFIPEDFKNAQMLAALSIKDGVDINAVKTDADLASFKVVGVYEESYQSGSNAPTLAQMPAVSRTLKPYTNAGLKGGGLSREEMGYL